MLRRVLLVYGLLALIGAFILLHVGAPLTLVAYLAVNGVVVVGGITLERSGYRPRVQRQLGAVAASSTAASGGQWERTGERFIDPVSGHLLEVRYNPATGERDYVEVGPEE
jgi:hypothetical protein